MLTLNTEIYNSKAASEYVDLCEKRFEKMLTTTAERIINDRSTRLITLAGPTCSGKTTTASKLTDVIDSLGYRARVLSIDDFYRDNLREEKNPDYESASAIDVEYFAECAEKLLSGEKVFLPVFDFKSSKRADLTEYIPCNNDIYIFEGIQAVYPEVTEHIKDFGFTSVFINVSEDVVANGVHIKRDEIRLMRRIVRDARFRSTGVVNTFNLWKNVRENEEKNIYPNVVDADFIINSYLPYETLLIGKYLIPLLDEVKETENYTEEMKRLSDKAQKVTSQYITEDMVPYRSMFREFIG